MKKTKTKPGFSPALAAAAGLAGLIISLLIAVGRGLEMGQPFYRLAGCLSGGFFAAGMLFALPGGVVLLASCGVFDRIVFAWLRRTRKDLPPRAGKRPLSYAAYHRQQAGKRRRRYTLLAVGLAFLLLAALSAALYYNLPN